MSLSPFITRAMLFLFIGMIAAVCGPGRALCRKNLQQARSGTWAGPMGVNPGFRTVNRR